jgi:hypothetical protein
VGVDKKKGVVDYFSNTGACSFDSPLRTMTLTGEHGRESSDTTLFYLPRTMDAWPWPRQINPHFEEVQAQSDAWFSTFNAFSDRSQHAFNVCDFGGCA